MQLTDIATQRVILSLLSNQDYRTEVLTLINTQFMDYAIDFFSRVAQAKLRNHTIDGDWYKREFVTNPDEKTDALIVNAGLNKKTISNMYGSSSRKVVLEVIPDYYDSLYESIQLLTANHAEIDITLTIKLNGVSVDLSITESLIVINTLAVKRAELRGGAWSTVGKSVEKALMLTLCKLFAVDARHYQLRCATEQSREIDFVLIDNAQTAYACEVKLMGKGNPESADAVIARDTRVFIADTLSELNRVQLTQRHIHWVELRAEHGYRKFYEVLQALNIPCQPFTGDIDIAVKHIFEELFKP